MIGEAQISHDRYRLHQNGSHAVIVRIDPPGSGITIRGTLAICPFAPRACPTAQPGQTHAWPMTALGKRACGHALKPFRSSRGLA